VDVEESQVGGVVTLKINGVEIFRRTDTTAFSAGTIMLGYMDSYNSIGSPDNYVIYDNLRVLNLTQGPPPSPTITGVRIAGANVEVDFTSPSGLPAQFTLETATAVTGTWQAASGAVITSPAAGQFRATAPYTADPARFFRIRR
jgi:hypothetical protein